jgi:hypothetical protein
MQITQKATKKGLEKQVQTFLKKNPQIEKALDVFNLSSRDYTKALTSLSKKQSFISFTNTNGDMGGNS